MLQAIFTKHNLLKRALFIGLFLFLLLDSVYLYNLNNRVETNTKVKDKLVELILLNKKLDLLFYQKVEYNDKKIITDDLKRFEFALKSIKQNKNLEDFFENTKYNANFVSVKRKFSEKKEIIEDFIRNNNEASALLSYSAKLFNDAFEKGNKNTNKIGKIHSSILQAILGEEIKIQNIRNKNYQYLKNAMDQHSYDYFEQADKVLATLQKLKFTEIKNFQIKLNDTLKIFYRNFNDYSNAIVNSLYINMSISLIIIVLFVLAISMLLTIVQENTKTMMQFQHAVQNSDNSVVITTTGHKILYVNDAFTKTTGYSKDEAIGQTPAILQSGLHDKNFYDEMKEKLNSGENWTGEFSNRRKDGAIVYEKASIYPMLNEKKEVEGYLGIKLNITGEKEYLREIESKNMEVLSRYQIDDETGLWSRNVLDDELARNTSGYLIYLKVKNFKDLRFFYGTQIANDIIKSFANKLKRFIYAYKVGGQPFRVGEDDFCIWYKPKKPSIDFLEAIHSSFSESIELSGGTPASIDVFIGVSTDRNFSQGNDRLLQSMIAFYKAEQQSLPYVYYYENNDVEKDYRNNLTVTETIKNALANNLVSVQCQPIYHTQTQEVYSYEVLMRIYDEKRKTIMYPGEFLKIAKQSSLYSPLMENVIYLAFQLVKSYPKVKFSINMSYIDMLHEDTSKLFLTMLESCEKPENVIIEILESEGITNYDIIRPFLNKAKSYGCQLSIDDFGSGYSNYYRIMQLDIDNIKIDGSIIKELPHDENSQVVVETIVNFARRKGCKIVAEFVSNEEIYKKVKKYGIEYTQGFYLGKPEELPIFSQD